MHYGQLHYVLAITLEPFKVKDPKFHLNKSTTYLLALVTPIKTRGVDATEAFVSYKDRDIEPNCFIDAQSIECLVGRIKTRGSWWIVDRSKGVARTIFEDDPV